MQKLRSISPSLFSTISRLFIISKFSSANYRYKAVSNMQNPLDVPTYRVGNEIYRRNCPLEMAKTTSHYATMTKNEMEEYEGIEAGAVLMEIEDQRKQQPQQSYNNGEIEEAEEEAQQTIDGCSTSAWNDIPEKSIVQKETRKTQTITVIAADAKTEVIQSEGIDKIELLRNVKYDAQQKHYYDSVKVITALIGMLKGREGHKQKKMEQKFHCRIHFPNKRSAKKEAEIKISSTHSAQMVQNCLEEMQKAIVQARKQAMPTHFVSIPIFDPTLRQQYSDLVERIRSDEDLQKECKDPTIFVPPAKLHLTLSVLKLFTDEEVQEAKHFLDRLFNSDKIREILAADEGKIRLAFPALEHFSDRSPEKVAVLFVKADSPGMQKLANAIDYALAEADLTERRKAGDVVLHMTMMNTKYLYEKRRTFLNVKTLLEKFGQVQFTSVDVNELHLCEMRGTNDQSGYKSVHSIRFSP